MAIESISVCGHLMYSNMYQLLKIIAIILVFTVTAERSFSILRKLNIYLRNTTLKSRFVGLALLSIYREIDVHDKIALHKIWQQ